ncbi:MAG TPA: ComEA family DNA-binding protein [Acholeplasmataceae bacterium]|jgi:competence protein ComEA|nr:ComEA family DNA-binding protein [Acholeplasmataceae bacterium]
MRKSWLKWTIIGAIAVIAIIASRAVNRKTEVLIPVVNTETPAATVVVVEVKGEVKKPGLYVLDAEARVNDLIILAGGFTGNADTTGVNLAARLTDGMVVHIASRSEDEETVKISINSASVEELMRLPGIGESRARSIVDYRKEHGRFNSLEELVNVNGISKNLLEQIKEIICL